MEVQAWKTRDHGVFNGILDMNEVLTSDLS